MYILVCLTANIYDLYITTTEKRKTNKQTNKNNKQTNKKLTKQKQTNNIKTHPAWKKTEDQY